MKKIFPYIYKVHFWTSLTAVFFFIASAATGLIILWQKPLTTFNTVGFNADEKKISAAEIWDKLGDGFGAIGRQYPGRQIESVAFDGRRQALAFKFSDNGETNYYDAESGIINAAAKTVARSGGLRWLLKFSHDFHAGRYFGGALQIFLIIAMTVAAVALLSGFFIYPFFYRRFFGTIRKPTESLRAFWADSHCLAGAVCGMFSLLLTLSGMLQVFFPPINAPDIEKAERSAHQYFSAMEREYGRVHPEAVILPSEALSRLQREVSNEENRLLLLKMPNDERDYYLFYLVPSPNGGLKHNAVKVVAMRPDGENIFVTSPPPFHVLLSRLFQLHRTWNANIWLKIIWSLYLLLSLYLAVSGLYLHACRGKRFGQLTKHCSIKTKTNAKDGNPAADNNSANANNIVNDKADPDIQLLILISLSLITAVGFFWPLIDRSGEAAAFILALPLVVTVGKMMMN